MLWEDAKTQSRTVCLYLNTLSCQIKEGRVRGKERDWFYFFCVCVFKKLDNVKCLKKKCNLQKDDVRKTFSVSQNHHEQCTIPRAAKQLPDRASRGEERRKEGKRVGEEGSWLVILYYVLMFKKNNVTLCFSLDLTILWANAILYHNTQTAPTVDQKRKGFFFFFWHKNYKNHKKQTKV